MYPTRRISHESVAATGCEEEEEFRLRQIKTFYFMQPEDCGSLSQNVGAVGITVSALRIVLALFHGHVPFSGYVPALLPSSGVFPLGFCRNVHGRECQKLAVSILEASRTDYDRTDADGREKPFIGL